jgi:hypothetical protein
MKLKRMITRSICLAALAALTACNERQPGVDQETNSLGGIRKEADDVMAAGQKMVSQTKAEAVAVSQKALDNMGSKIDALKQKAASNTGDAKSKTDAALDELGKLQDSAARQLDQLKGATQDTWKDAKAASDDAWSRLNEKYEQVKNDFNG